MKERHQTALRMRKEGATFKMIGDALGVGTSRANIIYQRALEVHAEEVAGLRMRSIRIVRGCADRLAEIAVLAEQDPDTAVVTLIREPNCDRRHAEEIIAWLKAGNRQLP